MRVKGIPGQVGISRNEINDDLEREDRKKNLWGQLKEWSRCG